MIRAALPKYGGNLWKRGFSTTPTTKEIPQEFGKKLFNLFKQSEYDKLADEIDRCPYRGDVNLMKLKVEALRASIIEKDENARRTINLIRYVEKSNYEPLCPSITSQNKVEELKK